MSGFTDWMGKHRWIGTTVTTIASTAGAMYLGPVGGGLAGGVVGGLFSLAEGHDWQTALEQGGVLAAEGALGGLLGGVIGGFARPVFGRAGATAFNDAARDLIGRRGSGLLFSRGGGGWTTDAIVGGMAGAAGFTLATRLKQHGPARISGGHSDGPAYTQQVNPPPPAGAAGTWIGHTPCNGTAPFVRPSGSTGDGDGFLFLPPCFPPAAIRGLGPTSTVGYWYNQLANSLCTNFQNLGTGTPQQLTLQALPTVETSGTSGILAADQEAAALNAAAQRFIATEQQVLKIVGDVSTTTSRARQNITELINHINTSAQQFAPTGTVANDVDNFMSLITKAFNEIQTAMDAAAAADKKAAEEAERRKNQLPKDPDKDGTGKSTTPEVKQPAQPPLPNVTVPQPTNSTPDITSPTIPGSDTTPTVPQPTNPDQQIPNVPNVDTPTTGNTNIPTPTDAGLAPAAGAAGAAGIDAMSSIMPMMLTQAMMQQMTNRDGRGDRERDRERERERADRREREAARQARSAPTNPTTTSPVVDRNQPDPGAAANRNQPPAGPPTGASAPPTNSGPPGRIPKADGSVTYTFPDGRTQKVSLVVAQALDAAFANTAGTDAQGAYAKTPAQWQKEHKPGDRVDPHKLMTGDVAKWDQRTAIVLALAPDDSGALELVATAKIQPFAAEMHDEQGDFGPFAGFFHPKGIEIVALPDQHAPAPSPTPWSTPTDHNTAVPAV